MKKIWIVILVTFLITSSSFAGFHAAVLGDRTGGADQAVFESIIDDIRSLHPDVVFCVGDLIEGPQPDSSAIHKQWDIVNGSLEVFTVPFYYVPGNNDIFNETSRKLYSERTRTKPYYSTDFQGVHVIVLDNSEARNVEEMGAAQLEWLKKDLAEHTTAPLTFVFFHKPFWYEAFENDKPCKLHDWFKEYGVDWVFSGHYHRYASTIKDGIHYVMVGSSGGHVGNNPDRGEFYHFGWMRVDGQDVDFSIIKADAVQPKDSVTLDKVVVQDRIESDLVDLERLKLDLDGHVQGAVTLSIGNNWSESLGGECLWETSSNWIVTPSKRLYTLNPTGPINLSFDCSFTGDSIYPLPKLTICYPWNDGSDYSFRRNIYVTRQLKLCRSKTSPKMDGLADDPCWDKAVQIEDFGDGEGNHSISEPISARMLCTDKDLYLHINADESRPDTMLLPADTRDGPVFRGDCVYVMFWSTAEPAQVSQFIVAPNGVINDGIGVIETESMTPPNMDREWNGDIDIAAADSSEGWKLEMKIPLSEITGSDQSKRLRFNMFRLQSRLGAFAVWQEPATYNPSDAAVLILP